MHVNFHQLESDAAMDELLGKVNLSVISPKTHETEVESYGFLREMVAFLLGRTKAQRNIIPVPWFDLDSEKFSKAPKKEGEGRKADVNLSAIRLFSKSLPFDEKCIIARSAKSLREVSMFLQICVFLNCSVWLQKCCRNCHINF